MNMGYAYKVSTALSRSYYNGFYLESDPVYFYKWKLYKKWLNKMAAPMTSERHIKRLS